MYAASLLSRKVSVAPARLMTMGAAQAQPSMAAAAPMTAAPAAQSSLSHPHPHRDRFVAGTAGAGLGTAALGIPAALGSAFGGWGMAAGMAVETAAVLGMSRGMNVGRPGIALAALTISFLAGGAGALFGWPGGLAVTAVGAGLCAGGAAWVAGLE